MKENNVPMYKPDDYISIKYVAALDNSTAYSAYRVFRKIAKRIVKTYYNMGSISDITYHHLIKREFPPADAIRSRQFLNGYLVRVSSFLLETEGRPYGYRRIDK